VILDSTYLFGLELRASIRKVAISTSSLLCIRGGLHRQSMGGPRFAVFETWDSTTCLFWRIEKCSSESGGHTFGDLVQ
jgi:hypothetical protein